jgi:hypothetical protein
VNLERSTPKGPKTLAELCNNPLPPLLAHSVTLAAGDTVNFKLVLPGNNPTCVYGFAVQFDESPATPTATPTVTNTPTATPTETPTPTITLTPKGFVLGLPRSLYAKNRTFIMQNLNVPELITTKAQRGSHCLYREPHVSLVGFGQCRRLLDPSNDGWHHFLQLTDHSASFLMQLVR